MEGTLTAKDFVSDQDVKWCPGCGDYSILKQMQQTLPELGYKKEDIVFISGIGCSSRFPYYMNTYGMHSIHGRAPSVASGLKIANPHLHVWVITGDGDALSIGGNHLIHTLRRNMDLNILLFNNEIYGLTKGQYSPTSHQGLKTKSSPLGSIDYPFNPLALALGADASFIARSMDRDPKHLRDMMRRTAEHKGTSLLEVYQNCPIFNDGVFEDFTDKKKKNSTTIYVEHQQPLIFGEDSELGIRLDGLTPEVVNYKKLGLSVNDLMIHDEKDLNKANLLTRFFDDPSKSKFPRPFGVIYAEERPTYEDLLVEQIENAKQAKTADLNALLAGSNFWEVK
ncbi:2-oxoglutarate ferredoxin oxidoreductase subunit beta [Candidatus Ornithobacterium hominis]|nr:2-oxoacid:ferredoxin oxidoreductase subunit beta [Candidatus Ornithobacterium hominis]CAI9429816.1 2-oxoglutarate ferredoxin oxidoreductase subunit beta [Candidatus Ornithobacterium hominis]